MHSSKLPFRHWLCAMFLMTYGKKGISACHLQKILEHTRYEPIWFMMQKIRITMGKRDDQYLLKNEVEIDEGFFVISKTKDDVPNKRGRGSLNTATVMVFAESQEVVNPKKHSKSRRCGYFKMKVVEDLTSKTVNKVVNESMSPESTALTDKYSSYSKLKDVLKEHIATKCPPKEASVKLPWVHTAISNAKRTLLGIYHQMDEKYLQNYLNEFCYRLNRRYMADVAFEKIMLQAVRTTWYN